MNVEMIKSRRLELNLTQQQAAERAGLKTAQRWNDIERGRERNLTVNTLEAIADVLKIPAADLLK